MFDSSDKEIPKRLNPKGEVLRELFLKSGNLCAFPGCYHLIMNPDGAFVGEICHIEAAEPRGERFNPLQTNEERREVQNLMLMCHDHHVVTNDVASFPVERMKQIKEDHEGKVNEFATHLQFKVVDLTTLDSPKPCILPKKLDTLWGSTLSDAELAVTASDLNALLNRLRELPNPARELLKVAIYRSYVEGWRDSRLVLPHEVDMACSLDRETAAQLWAILDRQGFSIDAGRDDYENAIFSLKSPGCDWDVWKSLLEFEKAGHATLHELVVNLNFSLFD